MTACYIVLACEDAVCTLNSWVNGQTGREAKSEGGNETNSSLVSSKGLIGTVGRRT